MESTGKSINRWVREGDSLFPKLFTPVLELIINKLNWNKYGLKIRGKYLNHLRFADDLVLLAETSGNLETMMHFLHAAKNYAKFI